MSQTFINLFSKINKPSESASSQPSRGVGDSIQTIEGYNMTNNTTTGTFTGLIVLLAIPALFITTLLFSTNNTHADDSITVTISGSPTITVAPTSEGTFADSGNINISVTNAPASGYTLAITGGGNTSLTGKTDNTKSITSISSAIDQNTFSTSSSYNNQWGYKPSMHYNTSTQQRATNTNYLPAPTNTADIIDITNDNSSNNYTMSIGARVTSDLGFQTYENNTFVITAVGNSSVLPCDPTKLCVEYEGNGLTYDGETLNRVNYNSTTTQKQITKYSHTLNISDDGTQSGNYPNNASTNDVVTIDGASSLHVKITYATESTSYDWAVIWAGNYPSYTAASNYSSGITCGGQGPKLGGTTKTTVECDISGDTVTFGFKSDGSVDNYGYYAIITGTGATIERTVASGEYATPAGTNPVFHGWSTTQTTPGGGLPSQVEYANESDVMANIPGNEGETQTLYAVWQQGQPITFNMDSNTSSIDIIDSNGTTVKTITASGQTAALAQGDTYTIKPTHVSGYVTNTITKTSGVGTLSGKQFTVGAGSATINVTSKQGTYIQDFTASMCQTQASSSNVEVIDKRDGKKYTVRYINGACWMTQNLAIEPGTIMTSSDTNINASSYTLPGTGYDLRSNGGGNCYGNGTSGAGYTNACTHVATDTDVTEAGSAACGGKSCTKEQLGAWYNYAAATAGTITGTSSYAEDTYNICPKGWTLPASGSSAGQIGSVINYASSFNPLYGGDYVYGSNPNATTYGFWWSTTRYYEYDRYALEYYDGSLKIRNQITYRFLGHYVRCVRTS